MTPAQLIYIAGLGSAALLAGAFGFQALGYAPCQMCLWQRWPHAIAFAMIPLALRYPSFAYLGALAALSTAGIGGFHAGVEQGWWSGPSSCSGGGAALAQMSAADLLSTAIPETVIMCDEIAWSFAGISMAGWNMIISLILAAIWLRAARR